MTQKAINYAEVLYQLKTDADELHEAETIVRQNPALQEALTCPVVSKKKKTEIIDKIFQKEIASFLKVLWARIRILTSFLTFARNIKYWRRKKQIFCLRRFIM